MAAKSAMGLACAFLRASPPSKSTLEPRDFPLNHGCLRERGCEPVETGGTGSGSYTEWPVVPIPPQVKHVFVLTTGIVVCPPGDGLDTHSVQLVEPKPPQLEHLRCSVLYPITKPLHDTVVVWMNSFNRTDNVLGENDPKTGLPL